MSQKIIGIDLGGDFYQIGNLNNMRRNQRKIDYQDQHFG